MAQRITQANLERLCSHVNKLLDRPATHWECDDDGRWRGQIGNFYIDGAYGGVALHEVVTESGGVRDVLSTGHVPKRELYEKMHAWLSGIEYARQTRGGGGKIMTKRHRYFEAGLKVIERTRWTWRIPPGLMPQAVTPGFLLDWSVPSSHEERRRAIANIYRLGRWNVHSQRNS